MTGLHAPPCYSTVHNLVYAYGTQQATCSPQWRVDETDLRAFFIAGISQLSFLSYTGQVDAVAGGRQRDLSNRRVESVFIQLAFIIAVESRWVGLML